MTQLKPEARADLAPGLAEAGGPGSGTPSASTIATRTVALAVTAVLVAAIATASAAGIGPALRWWPPALLAAVTVVYVAAIGFRLLMICVGSTVVPRLGAVPATRDEEHEARLPAYTVLAPLTGQGAAAETSRLIADLSALDYPAGRLEVLLLAGEGSELPPGELGDRFTVVNVGSATLAEAQARGLARASGELCVSYRPGQTPDRQQLRAAANALSQLPAWVVCVRSVSSTRNANANWLTRCATAEKAVNSVLLLRGLDRFKMVMPDGWGSAHFRTEALRQLGAWEAGERTADASLAIRIAQRGWRVRLFASVTAEQAESQLRGWLRERAEWLRDSNNAWLAAGRAPLRLWRDLGPGRFIGFQLTSALMGFTTFVNPVFWLLAVAWLVSGTGAVAGVLPAPELYLVVAAMLLGNVLTAYSLMIGCMEQGMFRAVRTMFLAPVYWALSSVAAYRALLPAGREQARAAAPMPSIAAS